MERQNQKKKADYCTLQQLQKQVDFCKPQESNQSRNQTEDRSMYTLGDRVNKTDYKCQLRKAN